jgi:hypothetical protein
MMAAKVIAQCIKLNFTAGAAWSDPRKLAGNETQDVNGWTDI